MKAILNLTKTILFIAITTLISCSKNPGIDPASSSPHAPAIFQPSTPVIFQPPPNVTINGNKEYHWGVQWDTSANGYKIIISTVLLTQEAINRGIDVYVAPWTEMSVFEKLPYSYQAFPGDTIHFAYSVIPGQLNVYATTNMSQAWDKSDIYLEYK